MNFWNLELQAGIAVPVDKSLYGAISDLQKAREGTIETDEQEDHVLAVRAVPVSVPRHPSE
jgi:hypothetical protein